MMAALDIVVREAQLRQEERASGQGSLFDLGGAAKDQPGRPEPQLPDVARYPESERLAREKEVVGFFITGHPLDKFADEMRVFSAVHTGNLKEFRDQKVEVACVVTSVSRQISRRNGSEWGRITIEDYHGTATILAFGDVWEAHHDILRQDAPVLIRGSVSGRDRDEDAPPIFLDDVVPLASLRSSGSLALEIVIDAGTDVDDLEKAGAAFRAHPGSAPLLVTWQAQRNGAAAAPDQGSSNGTEAASANGSTAASESARLKSKTVTVTPSHALLGDLRGLFGAEHVRLVRS
jgi:DNA polymerase-3 subunit alpha